ncbi:MAG: bifunctional shikimate kinase/3-dehydroquinate synthase [Solirubrobacterales bacterium]
MSLRPALVFIGFMGAGKSTAAEAAREAGIDCLDTDELLEAELGMPIYEFFERHGEEEFRRREGRFESALLREADGGAIALGGGSVLSESVREALGRHHVVWLQVDVESAWERIEGSGRPLGRDRARFEALLAERLPYYEGLADAVLPPGDPGQTGRALPHLMALDSLPDGTRMLWAASAGGEYPVYVGAGLLGAGWWPLEGRRFCVTDTTVGGLYADSVEPLAARIEVEPGEAAKTMDSAARVLGELTEAGMRRTDHVVALGGGVVGDLAGFCAHTYQRGVRLVGVPTTLVAQADSAYGGKTGVDLPQAKNYVGAYHLPAAVLADTSTLRSLPGRELAAGFAEVLKTGLLAGGSLWERVRGVDPLDPDALGGLVFDCARYKCAVVAADERDAGLRQVLNLGHTVGHAIEAASGYARHLHGEAVGLGLLAALRLSGVDDLRDEASARLEAAGLPRRLDPEVGTDEVLEALARDKKRTGAEVPFVLLSEPGKPRTGQVVEADRVREAVEELRG